MNSAPPLGSANNLSPKRANEPLVLGFYVNYDSGSLTSLRNHFQSLTHLAVQWFALQNANGDLEDEADTEILDFARNVGLPVLGLIHNARESWETEDLHRLLNDENSRANLIENIYANITAYGMAGVNIDFEGVTLQDREALVRFMHELRDKLKSAGFLVTQSVPVDDEAYDLPRLAEANDYLVVMAYDEHYASGIPGPIASDGWLDTNLARFASQVPREKTIMGIGNYGYDWTPDRPSADPLSFADVMTLARSRGSAVEWDEATGNPRLRYEEGGQEHDVWFLDAITAINQLRIAAHHKFAGHAVWRLGSEDSSLWNVINAWHASLVDERQAMEKLDAQSTVTQYGDGEVLHVADKPMDGARHIKQGTNGLFAEHYTAYPSYFVLESNVDLPEKTVALSFDDGPDARYTPRILDILKQYDVSATFFVVGEKAERSPNLLRRMYEDGHEIGNHTYSHPDLAKTSLQWSMMELNATQRIIQQVLGVSTTLFRPPYHADSEPQSPEEITPIIRAQEQGYVTVAERIDPRDWRPGVTADGIFEDVVAEQNNGHVILLHDSGGERSATVAALPRIIEHFRSEGYRFVAISEMLGKNRNDVMPAFSSWWETQWATFGGIAFRLKGLVASWTSTIFVMTICLLWARVVIYGSLAIRHKLRARQSTFKRYVPAVSVLIPAHNEEHYIVETVRAVLASHYPDLHVIVAENGSTDGTYEVLLQHFAGDPRVSLVQQQDSGKAAALNTALSLARSEIIVAIDADTVVSPLAIRKLVRHFMDPHVGAVSGNVRIRNRHTWLTRFQSIEYICAFNVERRALDVLNAITVVPGALGAWRLQTILAAGGFTNDTLAEDTDLTLGIRRLGYSIVYEEEALAYTEAPVTTRGLVKQRFRWLFGTLQAAWKHRSAFSVRYGTLGFIALPNIWLFQLVLPLISPITEMMMVASLVLGHWQIVLLYSSLLFLADVTTAVLAYSLERAHAVDLWFLLGQRFYYRYVLLYVTLVSFITALRGNYVPWQKTERQVPGLVHRPITMETVRA